MNTIKTIGVVGTGVIGASWTALFLAKGYKVIVTDPAPGAEEKLQAYLQKEWPTLTKIGLVPGASLQNYQFVENIDEYLGEVDYIQENGPERLDIKRPLITHLDANTRPDITIASSSSGLPSSQFVTDCTKNPSRILIGHPFNPPHLIPLVEVVPHPGTNAETISTAMNFYPKLGKDPVLVKQETPGFIANRLQAAVCNEAYSLVGRGVISAEDLDKTMTSGLGLRWAVNGPLMTNALGGGRSFRHFIDHIGPAVKSWGDDMKQYEFGHEPEKRDKVTEKVEEYVGGVDLDEVEKRRDEFILNSIQFKSSARGA
ncbi:uncharacterized protein ACHE_10484S [Aspergillus chevalieri]|uniref:3-hydroxyacyl-CoA dehydrogenase n=1 Tax=Aspergillus chevalieri TaxID=182096 RepID=A0A7R7VE12_ASPCH|nr:uncharacterized protein ACHE_10484S [Aspergillus chevalieri]BCR83082.1 hypothetical protein ACHE_10484S [Aspergillus chevalieri]